MLLLGGATELLIKDNIPVDFAQESNQSTPAPSKIMDKIHDHIRIKKKDD
jgi:hypothetical protein